MKSGRTSTKHHRISKVQLQSLATGGRAIQAANFVANAAFSRVLIYLYTTVCTTAYIDRQSYSKLEGTAPGGQACHAVITAQRAMSRYFCQLHFRRKLIYLSLKSLKAAESTKMQEFDRRIPSG